MASIYAEPPKITSYTNSMTETMVSATGKTLADWVEIAKTCSVEKPKERQKWFKNIHGILQNRSMLIFSTLDGKQTLGYENPEALVGQRFAKYLDHYVLAVVNEIKAAHPDINIAVRKQYVALQRKYQIGVLYSSKARLKLGLTLGKDTLAHPLMSPNTKPIGDGDQISHTITLKNKTNQDLVLDESIAIAYFR